MAIAAATIWEFNNTSTAGNVNGGGFNPSNSNFLTNASATSATGNSPVISSASYNFVAGDIGNWIYIKAGTNWTPGFYQIVSVAANAATVNAAIGAAVQLNTVTNRYSSNTVAGCATVASPTSGTFGVDYSQTATAKINGIADFNAVGASTTLTSVTAAFTPVMVGNIFHQTTTGTGAFGVTGWYEIVSYTNATTVVLDRTPNSGTASVNTTGYVGGALSMNSSLDDAAFEAGAAGNTFFIKTGSYTLGQSVSITLAGSATLPIMFVGYNSIRGDNPTGSNRPTIVQGAATFALGSRWSQFNIIHTGTASTVMTMNASSVLYNCSYINTSTTSGRTALVGNTGVIEACEAIAYRGYAIRTAVTSVIKNCYLHDSDTGIRTTNSDAAAMSFIGNIIAGCTVAAIDITGTPTGLVFVSGNTLYGAENKLGIGVNLGTATFILIENNIIYGFTTGINRAAVGDQASLYNDFNNNTTNATNWYTGSTDIAVAPSFINVVQVTGTGATSSTVTLTDGTKNFTALGVVAGRDYIYVTSATGVTVGIYGIILVGTTTLTLDITIGTGSSIAYQITTGKNWGVGSNLIATAFPGAFGGTNTVGYLDTGAVQRQEPSGAAGFGGVFF